MRDRMSACYHGNQFWFWFNLAIVCCRLPYQCCTSLSHTTMWWKNGKQTISRYFCCFSFSFLLAIRARKHIVASIIRRKNLISRSLTLHIKEREKMIGEEKERSFENYEFQNRRQHKLLHVFKVRGEKTTENLFSQPFVKILLDKFSVTIWSDGLRSKSSGAIAMEEFFRVLCCRWVDHHFHFHLPTSSRFLRLDAADGRMEFCDEYFFMIFCFHVLCVFEAEPVLSSDSMEIESLFFCNKFHRQDTSAPRQSTDQLINTWNFSSSELCYEKNSISSDRRIFMLLGIDCSRANGAKEICERSMRWII